VVQEEEEETDQEEIVRGLFEVHTEPEAVWAEGAAAEESCNRLNEGESAHEMNSKTRRSRTNAEGSTRRKKVPDDEPISFRAGYAN